MNRPLAQYFASPRPVRWRQRKAEGRPPRQLARRLDEATITRLLERYQAGETAAALAADIGVGKTSLLDLLRQRGVVLRRQPLTDGQVQEARRLREQGLLYREIGERLGVHKDTVRRALVVPTSP